MGIDSLQVEVVGLGQACMDYLGRIPFYPDPDRKVELLDLTYQGGGPASTALVTLSRLGVATAFIGSLSDDRIGTDILNNLKTEGIHIDCVKIMPGYSSQFAFIAISADHGQRNIFWHRGSVPALKKTDVDLSLFGGAGFLHLDGLMIEASIEAALQAKKMGLTVVMDAGTMREGSQDLLSLIDVLIASERFYEPVLGQDPLPGEALKFIKELCPGDVVITRGPKGSIGLYEGEIVFQNAYSVDTVDTTGAGDVYHGAYIFGLLNEYNLKERMRFASAAAAIKCARAGSRIGIPTLNQLVTFLKKGTNFHV